MVSSFQPLKDPKTMQQASKYFAVNFNMANLQNTINLYRAGDPGFFRRIDGGGISANNLMRVYLLTKDPASYATLV